MTLMLWVGSTAVMLALLGMLALRACRELLGIELKAPRMRPLPEKLSPASWPWPCVFIASLAILWLGAFISHLALTHSAGGFFAHYWERFTTAGDAERYRFIAEHGYVPAGENVINIVFYPLYPALMGLLGTVLGGRTALAGLIVSQACYGFSAVIFARLAKKECAHPGAALMAYWFYPFGFFAQGVYTEGLFLLLTVSALYLMGEQRWLGAGCVGLLCALTRVQGVLLLLPGVYMAWRAMRKDKKWQPKVLALLGPLLGFGIYLCVNKAVCGSFFAFKGYEAGAPWYQTAQWLGDTLAQQFTMAAAYPGIAPWIYWPQLALYFIAAALLIAGWRRELDNAYVLYGTAYLGMCYTAGWLISGGRYMLGCLPIYLCVGRLKNPVLRALILAAELIFFFVYNYWFMQGQAIM